MQPAQDAASFAHDTVGVGAAVSVQFVPAGVGSTMPMSMVQIRIVRKLMAEGLMAMPV